MTAQEPTSPTPLSAFTDEQASASIARATRIVALLAIVGLPLAWFRGGWQSAALLLVGAAISGSGLWEWRRLMAALMARMDARSPEDVAQSKAPSIGFALTGFFLRLLLVLAVLYVSLRYLNGSALALAAGLAMGVVALTFEGLRLLRSGTI